MSLDVASENSNSLNEEVKKVIDVIRPAIQADEGDIALHEVNEETGEVTVELFGACITCPASDQTLKAGIERILKVILFQLPFYRFLVDLIFAYLLKPL